MTIGTDKPQPNRDRSRRHARGSTCSIDTGISNSSVKFEETLRSAGQPARESTKIWRGQRFWYSKFWLWKSRKWPQTWEPTIRRKSLGHFMWSNLKSKYKKYKKTIIIVNCQANGRPNGRNRRRNWQPNSGHQSAIKVKIIRCRKRTSIIFCSSIPLSK